MDWPSVESACGGGSCGSDPFDRDDFEPIAPLLECATCRGEGAGLPGVEAIYCISLKELPNRAKAAAGLFHALGLCRHVTMYRPHRGAYAARDMDFAQGRRLPCATSGLSAGGDLRGRCDDQDRRRKVAPPRCRCLALPAIAGLGTLPRSHSDAGLSGVGSFDADQIGKCSRLYRQHAAARLDRPHDAHGCERAGAALGTSIDAAMANLPHMFAMFPMVATQRFLGDHRVDPKFAAPGQRESSPTLYATANG